MKVVTFGELMIRLQPFNYERFVQANNLEFTFGGGEANVAVSLANYGIDAAFVTKLPAHAIGQAAVNSLRRYGVDTSKITRGAIALVSTSTRRALLSVVPSASTTAPTPPFSWLLPPTSTGMPSSRAWTGSTSPASPRLWARMLLRSAARPARLLRLMASRSAAT